MTAYEQALFGRCSECRCSSEDLAQAGNRCPRMVATTEPGELAETREKRKPGGAGLMLSVVLVLACWAIGAGVATWIAPVAKVAAR
ncbi:MAG: hypothetical protein RJB26_793 [Pseudomonadota bacterium]|jgi:uncharacterized protein HemX